MADLPEQPQMPEAPVADAQQPAVPMDAGHVDIYDISGAAPVLGKIAPHEVTDAVASGKFSFPEGKPVQVMSPEGELGTLDPKEAPLAFQNGYRYATQQDIDALKYGTPGQQVAAGVEGLARGVAGPVATGMERLLGVPAEDERKRAEANPGIAKGSEAVGFLSPAIATLGAAGLARAGVQGAAEALPAIASLSEATQAGIAARAGESAAQALGMNGEAASLAGKLAQGGVKMGAEMALFQSGDEATKALQQDPEQNAQTAMAHIGAAAIFGGALGVGASGASALWKAKIGPQLSRALSSIKADANGLPNTGEAAINPVMAKVLAVATNTSEKDIAEYAAKRAEVNAAPSSDEIYEHVLSHVNKINENIATATTKVDETGAAYKELYESTKQAYKERGYDAADAAREAQKDLKEAQRQAVADHLEGALGQAKPIAKATETLREQVVNGSANAYDVLNRANETIPMQPVFNKGMDLVAELRDKGTLESKAMGDRLETYLKQLPQGEIEAPKAKMLIQGLDDVSKYDFNASQFDKGLSRYYKQLRYELDDTLKSAVPEYREAMKPVADKTKLLKALDRYGSEEEATRALKGIKNPDRYKNEMPLLRQLEEHTGAKFADNLEPYANPEMRAHLSKSLPEYEEYEKAASISKAMKDPRVIQEMKDALAESPEYKAYLKAQAAQEAAQAAKKEISGVTESNIASKLRQGELGRQDALTLLGKMPELNGKALPELVRLSRLQNVFTHKAINGSRNTLLHSIAGGLIGRMFGHEGAGLGFGGAFGASVDHYGPSIAKHLIDAYLDHFGSVSKMVGKEAPDTLRAAVARFLDKDAALTVSGKTDLGATPDIVGFKSMVDYIDNLMRGEAMLKKATKNVFKGEGDVLPKSAMPSEADRGRLEKHLQKFWETADSPDIVKHMDKTLGPVNRYLPEQGEAMTATASNVANYLKNVKPQVQKLGMLDSPMPLNGLQKSQWTRTLNIAQQPLTILNDIRKGTLTVRDVQDVKGMYPALYSKLVQELTSSMVDHAAKGNMVPYKTRLSLSLFAGQPLDSTMTPMAIQNAQPQQNQPLPQGAQPSRKTSRLSKLPQGAQTPGQAREQEKQKHE